MNTAFQSASKLMSSIGLKVAIVDSPKQSRFNRAKLPSPESFWASHSIKLKSKKGWIMAKCAFHDDHHASLGINTETGDFFCHACGAKGGDVLSAYQLLNGCDFVTAAKALGAWEEK
jgi:hypothetical protein